MRNPELTKAKIIEVSSKLFNIQGYKATSISDITKEASITKGAIYAHFDSKSSLERESLLYMTNNMVDGLGQKIAERKNVKEKMEAIFEYFRGYTFGSHNYGGCPVMNAAVEADDTNPELRKVVTDIIKAIENGIVKVLNNGVKHGQLRSDVDAKSYASFLFSSLEGAIMLTKATGDRRHINVVIENLQMQFDSMLV